MTFLKSAPSIWRSRLITNLQLPAAPTRPAMRAASGVSHVTACGLRRESMRPPSVAVPRPAPRPHATRGSAPNSTCTWAGPREVINPLSLPRPWTMLWASKDSIPGVTRDEAQHVLVQRCSKAWTDRQGKKSSMVMRLLTKSNNFGRGCFQRPLVAHVCDRNMWKKVTCRQDVQISTCFSLVILSIRVSFTHQDSKPLLQQGTQKQTVL